MINSNRRAPAACIALLATAGTWGLGSAALAEERDEAIEEVVVTGSYLKRSAQDSPSPLSVVTAADIEDIGAADVAEIVQTLPWQSGSQTRATTFSGEGADGRASINLRNLGHGSTLVLANGKRHVKSWFNPRGNASVNINTLMPNIAIERIEIVKDGAAATYGSDAIAGVVNFISKKNFEGFDFNYQFTTDDETGEGDTNQANAIWGVQGDRGGIVASVGILKRKEITIGDRYDRFGGSSASSTGQPGRITPLAGENVFDTAGNLIGTIGDATTGAAASAAFGRQADLDCENAAAADGEGGTLGPVFGGLICAYDFGPFFALQANESLRQFHVTGHYDLSDSLTTYFEMSNTDSRFDRLNSLNPNALNLTIPTTNLGNIEDAARRGIMPIQTINRTRMVGQTRNDPTRPVDTFTNTNRTDQRFVLGGTWEGEFMQRPWTVDMSYTASEHNSATSQVQDTLSSHLELAMSGFGGPTCDPTNPASVPGEGNAAFAASGGDFNAGNCYFFNPYGSNRFDRNGNPQTDLTLVNPDGLYEWLLGRITSDENYRSRVIELVASGEVFDLPSGAAQLAVGYQRRRETGEVIFDAAANTGNLDFAFGAKDWRGDLTTNALFLELLVPLHETLDLTVAGRYESFKELDDETFDPKITLLWRPIDSLSGRFSYSTSFKVPSVQQLFGSITTVANQTDFGGDSAFRPSITDGNPQLKPETARTFNFGASWAPTDGFAEGFQIDVDYYNYQYEDIITREPSATLLAEDNAALAAFIDANPGASLIDAVNAGAGNRTQVVRNGQGLLLRILPDFINADSADISGIDITTSYRFDTDYGLFRLGLAGNYVVEYEIKSNGVKFNGKGNYNEFTPVARPLPDFKFNATLNWSLGRHSFYALIQYTPELDYGVDIATDPRAGAARFWRATRTLALGQKAGDEFFTRRIDSFTTANLSYTYEFTDVGPLAGARLTFGVNNVANAEPPFIPINTGFDATLHDPRGRVWYGRVAASL